MLPSYATSGQQGDRPSDALIRVRRPARLTPLVAGSDSMRAGLRALGRSTLIAHIPCALSLSEDSRRVHSLSLHHLRLQALLLLLQLCLAVPFRSAAAFILTCPECGQISSVDGSSLANNRVGEAKAESSQQRLEIRGTAVRQTAAQHRSDQIELLSFDFPNNTTTNYHTTPTNHTCQRPTKSCCNCCSVHQPPRVRLTSTSYSFILSEQLDCL